MPDSFTLIPVTQTYYIPGDPDIPAGSTVTFTLSAPMTNTVTGDIEEAVPHVVPISRAGLMSVTLPATTDPTTSPVGVTYTVVERIGNAGRSYAVPIRHDQGALVLGLIAPADVAPPVTYGLSNIVAVAPLSGVLASGVYTLSLDGSGYTTDAELAAEVSTRAGADSVLSGLITAEAGTARAAESANATAISTETTNRTTADSAHAALTGASAHTGLALTTHTHAEADTTGLVSDLAGKAATAHTHTHASTTGQGTDDHHAKSHTHSGDGSGTIPNVVAAGASGLLTGADKTKLDGIASGAQTGTVTSVAATVPGVLFSIGGSPITGAGTLALTLLTQTANTVLAGPTSGGAATPTLRALVAADVPDLSAVYLPVARLTGGGVLATGGFTLTLPATGTAALIGTDNVFVKQGIRVAASTNAAGLYVPWVSGDSTTSLVAGSGTSGNTQVGVQGLSDSNAGVWGTTNSGRGLQGTAVTGTGVLGTLSGAGISAIEGRYTGSAVTAPTLLYVNNATTGTGAAGTGATILIASKSDTTLSRGLAQLTSTWVVATDASRTARVQLYAYDTAAREILRGEASGTAPMIGFLGSAAQAKPTVTGSRGSNVALASLLTALAAYGLITDSSS